MNIYLVRHAQSLSNIDFNVLKSYTNMSIGLSEQGIEQAKETGHFFSELFKNSTGIKIWNSPYNRTRKTSEIIQDSLKINQIDFELEESIYLSERQFGLVDDVHDYREKYPHENKHWTMHKEQQHEFFARPPLGESGFDMCLRLDFFLKQILPLDNQIKHHVIVSHGAAIRGLIMMHQKWTYEKYNSPNPFNASVTKIENSILKGIVFIPSVKTS